MKSCAILTMDSLADFEAYDHLLEAPLAQLGWSMVMVSWREKNVNWNDYDAVIIRSPWDYQDEPHAFMQVLTEIDNSSAHLENSLATVKWNIDKSYLKQLEDKGVSIVPTLWQERQSDFTAELLASYFEHFNTNQIVLKPRISANADNTFWLTSENTQQSMALLNTAFSTRNFMAQPFMEAIVNEGEYSLFYFNGNFSHCILKTPKDTDFRVQEEHGGQLKTATPEAELIKQADIALQAIDEMPLYARLDFVRHQNSFAMMEAELIEPSLYFNMDEKSAARFAQAFVDKMHKLSL